jgi:hypothetical protein
MLLHLLNKTATKAAILLILLSQTSCISPVLTGFGKEKISVSASERDVLVSSEASSKPKAITESAGKIKVSKSGSGDLVTAKKPGFQTEKMSVTPTVKKKYYRAVDIAFSAGVGLGCIVAYTTTGSPEVVQQASASIGGLSALFTYLNAAWPFPSYAGAYHGYAKDEAVKFKMYPDSIANPKKALVLLSELTTEIKGNETIGKYTYYQKTKGDVKSPSKLQDRLENVQEPIADLLLSLKLSPGTSAAELKELRKKSILERSLQPDLLLEGKLKTLACDVQYCGSQDSVFHTTVSVEWTLTDRNGRAILSKTTKGYGQRNLIVVYAFNGVTNPDLVDEKTMVKVGNSFIAQGFDLSLTDGVRRSANEFLFDPEVKKLISNFAKDFKSSNFEKYTTDLKIAKPTPLKVEKPLNEIAKSVVTIIVGKSHGSGTVISSDGYILTNAHVCGADTLLNVRFKNGQEAKAKLVRLNVEYDLALLKLSKFEGKGVIAVENNENTEAGESVFIIGTPADLELGQSISTGLLSGIRTIKDKKYFQTDAAINGGNSGGAMLNDTYNLIGIPSSKIKGVGLEGLGFAIPTEVAFKMLKIRY